MQEIPSSAPKRLFVLSVTNHKSDSQFQLAFSKSWYTVVGVRYLALTRLPAAAAAVSLANL